jgi:hypothetical protein
MAKSKHKRVVCETSLDSDSEDERDINVATVVDNKGRGTSSRNVHIEKAPLKRSKRESVEPVDKSADTAAFTEGDSLATQAKRKQVSANLPSNLVFHP